MGDGGAGVGPDEIARGGVGRFEFAGEGGGEATRGVEDDVDGEVGRDGLRDGEGFFVEGVSLEVSVEGERV